MYLYDRFYIYGYENITDQQCFNLNGLNISWQAGILANCIDPLDRAVFTAGMSKIKYFQVQNAITLLRGGSYIEKLSPEDQALALFKEVQARRLSDFYFKEWHSGNKEEKLLKRLEIDKRKFEIIKKLPPHRIPIYIYLFCTKKS